MTAVRGHCLDFRTCDDAPSSIVDPAVIHVFGKIEGVVHVTLAHKFDAASEPYILQMPSRLRSCGQETRHFRSVSPLEKYNGSRDLVAFVCVMKGKRGKLLLRFR